MSVFVVGHQNPDTDAICSAIGYAEFLRQTTRPDAVAVACGPMNVRTAYVLEEAGLEAPNIVSSVRPTAGRIGNKPIFGRPEEPFMHLYHRMQKHGLRTMPMVDAEGKLLGMLSLFNLMQMLIPDSGDMAETRVVSSSIKRMCDAVGGKLLNGVDVDKKERLMLMIAAMSKESYTNRLHRFPAEQALIVAGDRPSVHRPSIEHGVRLIVITGKHGIDDDLLAQAKEKGVSIIVSPHDTAMTTMLIKSSKWATPAMETDILSFRSDEHLDVVERKIRNTGQSAFPVLDADQKLLSVFTKTDLLYPERTQLILVDHNEISQAIDGADEAEILEVIDHHRLGGGLVSREPIRFINEVVGSTCTIVARMFRREAMYVPPEYALCLAGGIISDTLLLTSPTTTDTDREMLNWLETCAGRDLKEFAKEFFAVGSALTNLPADEILNGDCKRYNEGEIKFTVAQVEELGLDHFDPRKDELTAALQQFRLDHKLDMACLLITDITRHESLLLLDATDAIEEAMDFTLNGQEVYELPGVVSRKKQLLPALIQGLDHLG